MSVSNTNTSINTSTSITNNKTIQVFSADMTDEMRSHALEISYAAFQMATSNGKVFSTIASRIRDNFDKDYGYGWNCIVGKSFGSCVTHEMKKYM